MSAIAYVHDLGNARVRHVTTYGRSLWRVIDGVSSIMVDTFVIRDFEWVWVATRIKGY